MKIVLALDRSWLSPITAAWFEFTLCVGLIGIAGSRLSRYGDVIAEKTGLSGTWIGLILLATGTLFVAFATSVPEIVVTVSALRIGALDMAIGNLLGSNLFNIAIVAVDDLFFLKGPILSHVSPLHAVSAMSAIMMTGVAITGLLYRPKTRLFQTVGWASLLLLSLYLLNSYVLYLYGE